MALRFDDGIKKRHSISVENPTNQPDIKQNSENNSKLTEKDIETKFQQIFEKYNQKFSFEILQKMFGDEYSKENLLKCDKKALEDLAQKLDIAFLNADNGNTKNVKKAETLEEFFEKYSNNDSGTIDIKGTESISFASSELKSILDKMNDDEKIKYANEITKKLKNQPDLLDIFFKSIEDKEKRRMCADNIDIKQISYEGRGIIIKYKSVPCTEKLNKENEECAKDIYCHYPKLIENVFGGNPSDEEINKRIEALTDEHEKQIALEYASCLNIREIILTDAITNKEKYSSDPNAATAIIEDINNSAKEQPGYEIFLERIAKIISNTPENELNINKNKLSELLDKISDNKFSETVQNLSKKTATDEKTGGFKNDAQTGKIQAASDNAEKILETITPKEDKTFVVVKDDTTKSSLPETDTVDNLTQTESFFEKFSREFTENILTGKVKTYSSVIETIAIDNYKRMDFAEQGKLLQCSIGKFFNKLIDNTKTYTLENLLATGWKGATFSITKEVKDTVEDRKNKLNPNSLPS